MIGWRWHSRFSVPEVSSPVTTTSLDHVLEQFHADLQRAEHLLNLVKAFKKFATSSIPIEIENTSVVWPAAVGLAESAPRVRTDLPIFSGSILVYVCGRFESFIREVVIMMADEMATGVKTFGELPEVVRTHLQSRTLEISQNPRRFGFAEAEVEGLIIALGQNLLTPPTAGAVTISSKVLAVTESNMNSRTLADVFKRVNVNGLWSDLGKQAPLKSHLSMGGDKECTTEASSRLDTIMRERNSIAHPVGTFTFPDPDQVLESVHFLKVLSRIVIDLTQVPR